MSDAGRKLQLEVLWKTVDQMTANTRKILGTNKEMARGLKETRDRLKELEKTQKTVGEFRELHKGLRGTSTALRAAEERVQQLARGIKETETPTRAMTREFNVAVRAARDLNNQHQQQSQKLQALRDRLSAAKVSTRDLGTHERQLRGDIAATNAAMATQRDRLVQLQRQQERMSVARERRDKLRSTAGAMAGAGIGATAAGAVVGMPVKSGLHESKHMATEIQRVRALGLSDKETKEAIDFARQMKTFGTSRTENTELMRDALTVFADAHHAEMVTPLLAKMKFANKALYGDEKGEENDKKFMDMLKVIEMRGGLTSEAEFNKQANMVQKVLTATGGRVGPEEWLNLIKTGGLAAKGINSDAFYYQLEPLVQEMSGNRVGTALMSAYSGLYQGRTTKRAAQNLDALGLIGDRSKVSNDKAGQIAHINPGALKGSELFRENQFEWMEQVLLPALAAKGITEKQAVLDAIGGIFSNRTASNLFGQMYLQRDQIRKNEKLNRGAADIGTLDKLAKDSPTGKELDLQAKVHDLWLEMGERVLPMYVAGVEGLSGVVKGLTGFMEHHTVVAKVVMLAIAGIAGALLLIGPAMLALAAVLGPLAVLRFMMQAAGIQGGVLSTVMRLLGGAIRFVGSSLLWMGRMLLTTPIGLALTAIAVAAYLIYRNWDQVKTFFLGIWNEIKSAFSGGIAGVTALILDWSPLGIFYRAFAGVMSWFGVELPSKFSEFGTNIVNGLANGITSAASYVKDAVVGLGERTVSWFKEKLGIHSPSRVFAELGGFTMAGLEQGITGNQDGPLSAVQQLARQIAGAGAGLAIAAGSPALASTAFDMRPPISSPLQSAAPVAGNHYEIHIHAAPGMNESQLAQLVERKIIELQRKDAARARSRFGDKD
ncbi:phage tail protein [Pandoraea captiosa]|uniref:Phage tail protein n=1 Tax=Pandoraea captiosa TaxID=2508302 RepID=A0A5E5APP5_9BURK|nr:phage tail protein [Pandoraea captiosa]VVE74772.1 phage tail protein [Pandoraea captiosa]